MYHIFAKTPILKSMYAEGGLFGAAKTKTKTAAKKGDKIEVQVPGITEQLNTYNMMKDQIADATAKLKMVEGEVKALAKEKFIELYEKNGSNPGSFYLTGDKGGCVMVVPTDRYLSFKAEDDPNRQQLLGDLDLIETEVRFYFNNQVLERNQAEIEKLIMGSKKISDADKENLLMKESTSTVKKGTINLLATFGAKMREVFQYAGIVIQHKNCGSKEMADGGETGEEMFPEEGSEYGGGGWFRGKRAKGKRSDGGFAADGQKVSGSMATGGGVGKSFPKSKVEDLLIDYVSNAGVVNRVSKKKHREFIDKLKKQSYTKSELEDLLVDYASYTGVVSSISKKKHDQFVEKLSYGGSMATGGKVKVEYVSFYADNNESADLFDEVDFDYPSERDGNMFYFEIPKSMSSDELTDILEGAIKHNDDIKGDWGSGTRFVITPKKNSGSMATEVS